MKTSLAGSIRARFVLTFGTGEQRVDTTALERTMRPSNISGTPIALGISSPGVTALNQVSAAQSFVPYIDLGTDAADGPAFRLHDMDGRPLSSVRLELETSGPGIAKKTHTRVLWESSSSTEPALAILHNYEMLVVCGPVGESFSNAMMLATVAHMGPLLLWAATPAAQRVVPAVRDLEPAFPVALLDYVNRELRIAGALRSASPSVRFTFDRPNIVMLSNGSNALDRTFAGPLHSISSTMVSVQLQPIRPSRALQTSNAASSTRMSSNMS